MLNPFEKNHVLQQLTDLSEKWSGANLELARATVERMAVTQGYFTGLNKYLREFMEPYWIALDAFTGTEQRKVFEIPVWESYRDYLELLRFNMQVAERGVAGSGESMERFHTRKAREAWEAWLNTLTWRDGVKIGTFFAHEAELLRKVIYDYPKAIRDIAPEYGFHFDGDGYIKVAETDRFELYQVMPQEPGVEVRQDGKPVIVVHPYVLGANIVCFLPGERKSFVHAYADQGVPTYVRVMKDIAVTPAAQVMTGEDDARDTRLFAEKVMERHGRPATINGFCQGGFIVMCELLSGELDGVVDCLITCVSPMDGTRSKSLVEYLEHLPLRFRDLGYAVKTLPSGNQVVDGKVMSWVYKLKSMEKEAPLVSFYRDLEMFDRGGADFRISKTAAAINHWLIYDRNDLPESITKMSFDSYTLPVAKDGTLPVKLFGRELNFKRIAAKGQRLQICYAERDDLVDKETAIAPADFVECEVTPYPKGHGAIATSWSDPRTDCALHKTFGDGRRGPVRFHLDLDEEQRAAARKPRR